MLVQTKLGSDPTRKIGNHIIYLPPINIRVETIGFLHGSGAGLIPRSQREFLAQRKRD